MNGIPKWRQNKCNSPVFWECVLVGDGWRVVAKMNLSRSVMIVIKCNSEIFLQEIYCSQIFYMRFLYAIAIKIPIQEFLKHYFHQVWLIL